MIQPTMLWLGLLAAAYAVLWRWYGGSGRALTAPEGEMLLARMEALYGVDRHTSPPGSLIRNLAAMVPHDDGKEFYAVNLEKRMTGAAALAEEARYSRMVLPMLLKRGGHPVFVSERAGLMLGEYGNHVNRVAVVRYRSLRDLFDMVLDPSMPEASRHKYGALEHTEVFITRPTLTIVQMRSFLGLIFTVLGLAGVLVLPSVS